MPSNLLHKYGLDISQLEYEKSVLEAELSFYEFFKQAWHVIEPGVELVDGWYLQAVADHLQAAFQRDIKRLIINIPPRTNKTNLCSVAFPAWVWIHNPSEQFVYASYSDSLAKGHSLKCRRLIDSLWFQQRWGHRFRLSKDQNAKGFFDNNRNGARITTSVRATTTGRGGNILIADDPNNANEAESEVKLQRVRDWWDGTWASRLNNPKHDVKILMQQRIHALDNTGHVLANDEDEEWKKLILPMEFEVGRRARTIILPNTNGKVWEDPRTYEGELLCADRISIKEINQLKRDLGTYGYSGQYQQRPSPEEGGIIKKAWFQWWKQDTLPEMEFVLQSWDTAISDEDYSSYSACTTWGIFRDRHYIENIMLLSLWRGRLEYPELRDMMKRLYYDYRNTDTLSNPKFTGRVVDLCLVESKASGLPLIQDMNRAGIRAVPVIPKGEKIGRVRMVSALIEAGRVWIPAQAPQFTRLIPEAEKLIEEVVSFPTGASDDIIDSMTQALSRFRDGNFVRHPADKIPVRPSHKPAIIY